MSRDKAHLIDILNAARLAAGFVAGRDEAGFRQDLQLQSAVLHQLTVAGEAVKRLSETFRASHPEIPWADIAGMRDVLIHDYDDVDLREVWRTATVDVPSLIGRLEPLART